MSKRVISGIMLTLLLTGMLTLAYNIQPVKAPISGYEWIDPAYIGYDPFFGAFVVAYRTGSIAKIAVTVLNDWFVTDTILNISVVKLRFDWGKDYLSTEVSPEDPFELPWNETRTFNVSFTVPPTNIASNKVLHEFEIWVEHVDAQHNTIGSWVVYCNNFAVYPKPILGDVDGDGTVSINDVVKAVLAFGSSVGEPNMLGEPYNPDADLNNDGIINIIDLVIIGVHFGETL